MRRRLLACAAGAMLLATPALGADMSADVINDKGESIGTVTFSATPSGMVHIVADVSGLPEGAHGFHIHAVGTCDPADGFKSAGGHYAGDKEHGILAEGGPHPGDLPNVHVGADGSLKVEFFTDQISVGDSGENPLADADGSSVMVHADPDDYTSQPSGAAGARIACGVIN